MATLPEVFSSIVTRFQEWGTLLSDNLGGIIAALIVIVLFGIIGKVAEKISRVALRKFSKNRSLNRFLGKFVFFILLVVGVLFSLSLLNLDKAVFSVLAGVGIVGIALGFAFQDMAANFIAGIALVFDKDYPFKLGDVVESNGDFGAVERIDLRSSMLRNPQGEAIFIPNKSVFENTVKNYTDQKKRRVELDVGVSYAEDLKHVDKVVRECIDTIPQRLKDTKIEVYFFEFADSSINFRLRFWIPFEKMSDYWNARDKAVHAIKEAFDKEGITIPFPIRTVDFGIKGGATLSEELSKKN